MCTDFNEAMNEAFGIADKLNKLVPRTESYYDYFGSNNYKGQKSLRKTIKSLIYEFANHSDAGITERGCWECKFLLHYIQFRLDFINLESSLLSKILVVHMAPIDAKRQLLRMGMSSREALDLIAAVRKRGAWILALGGYDAVVNGIVRDVPEFRASC